MCRTERDFPTLAKYNAFLERSEDWVHALATGDGAEEAKKEIEEEKERLGKRLGEFQVRF